jgi:MoaA/NifB/PqqE/SkfB family radical SAM enzyme
MCSYRKALPNELTLVEVESLAHQLSQFGLRHIVYSGGEPLLRRDFPAICAIFRQLGVQQTLLTNGLLLEKRLPEIQKFLSGIIVSLDGATTKTHNAIRGVESFDKIVEGIRRAVGSHSQVSVSVRTVLQKQNFREIREMIDLVKSLGVRKISFLAADVLSKSFGRDTRGSVAPDESIALDEAEVVEFRRIIDRLLANNRSDFEGGIISETPEKMYHIVEYFEALIGKRPFPRNYCNAPMVSAVITSTGEIQPCFFLPSYGNVREKQVDELENNEQAQQTRKKVRDYELERCQTCVCTLHLTPLHALIDPC